MPESRLHSDMTGFVGLMCRGAPRLDPAQTDALMARLSADGSAAIQVDSLALFARGWANHVRGSDGLHVVGGAHLVNRLEIDSDCGATDPLEIVAALYRKRGLEGLARLQGQFCLALYDPAARQLVLATDPFATRPIYYAERVGLLSFGTNLRQVAGQHRVIDQQAILEYLLYSAIPAPRTAFTGVSKLPGGHLLIANRSGMRLHRYWDMSYAESRNGNGRSWAHQLRSEIGAAMRRYVTAEESLDRVGAFLSGGTDSSTVAGMLSSITGKPAKTFSIGYVEHGYDELFYARVASRWFSTLQHEWKLSPSEAFSRLPAIVSYYEEPFGNASALPTYCCAQLAREHGVTVLFAGDGGDELFAGNERYGTDKIFALYHRIPGPLRRGIMDPMLSALPDQIPVLGRARRYVRRANIANPRRIFSYSPMLSEPLADLLAPDFLAAVTAGDLLGPAEARYHRLPPGTSELNRLLYLDLKLAIADNDVRKVSGMTELAGLEVRYPFLDTRLAEFSGRIPSPLKLRGFQKRYIFKQALADFLPPEVLKKQKHGFGVPVAVWMKTDRCWHAFVGDLLHDSAARQRGYLQPRVLDELWAQLEEDGAAYYGDSLWPWLMLELWHREHVEGKREGSNGW
ncbi:MAG: asparagine synthetase B family protein [Candidatus Binatia bacterium]